MDTLWNTKYLSAISIGAGIAGMASFWWFKKTQKENPIPKKISLAAFLQGDQNAANQFCESMIKYRFVIFECDDETKASIEEYKKSGGQFFSQDESTKSTFSPQQKDPLMQERKVNKGYLVIPGMKEFLKLQLTDPDDSIPNQPASLNSSFKNAATRLDNIANRCLDVVSVFPVHNQPFMKSDLREVVKRTDKSSLSLVHYFAMAYQSKDDTNNDSSEYSNDPNDNAKDSLTQQGMTYPSKTHTDTGIMTFIICAEVPGLQVWDTLNDEWLEVEKICNPKCDLFVIAGRKLPLFYQKGGHESPFRATRHRVALPLNTERTSLLYFLDVKG